MPPVTPSATFMVIRMRSTAERLRVVPESLIQNLSGLLGRAASFRNLPLHLARADFILRDAARLAGVGLHHRWGSGLQLAGAPRGDQNITIVAVEAFDQFHGLSPLQLGHKILISENCRSSLLLLPLFGASASVAEAKNYSPIFPRTSRLRGLPASPSGYRGLPRPGTDRRLERV